MPLAPNLIVYPLFMRPAFIAAIALFSLATTNSAAPTDTDARAQELMRELHLHVLPKESGYLGLIGESAQRATIGGRSLAIQSQVYYMLTRDRPINYLHWLAPDDTHILIEGGPVDYFIFHPDGHVEKVVAGPRCSSWRAASRRSARRLLEGSQAARGSQLRPDGQCALTRVHAGSRTHRCRTGVDQSLQR